MNTFNRIATSKAVRVLVCAALCLGAAASFAGTDSGTLSVRATLLHQCSIGGATLSPAAIRSITRNGTVAGTLSSSGASGDMPWTCTHGTTGTVRVGEGTHKTSTGWSGAQPSMTYRSTDTETDTITIAFEP